METVHRLFDGPLDVVGDVHGHLAALDDLLHHMGYAADGRHPEGRRLVFVGDLVDRGPDNPGVVERVAAIVAAGNAQCVLGNHELNILRGVQKHDNGWYFASDTDAGRSHNAITGIRRDEIARFFQSLPLALEREDLRVVHACWHAESIACLQDAAEHATAAEGYAFYRNETDERMKSDGLWEQYRQEREAFGSLVHFGDKRPEEHWPDATMLTGYAAVEEAQQMGNPVAVLTSGPEYKAKQTFPMAGRYRFVDRSPWWNNYGDAQAVIVGHYWRPYANHSAGKARSAIPDIFSGTGPDEWLGDAKKVYCVDFSVAGRAYGHSHEVCRLGAVRWPEQVVAFDDGEEIRLAGSSDAVV